MCIKNVIVQDIAKHTKIINTTKINQKYMRKRGELEEYIRKCREKGIGDNKIKGKLREAGHQEDKIDESFDKLNRFFRSRKRKNIVLAFSVLILLLFAFGYMFLFLYDNVEYAGLSEREVFKEVDFRNVVGWWEENCNIEQEDTIVNIIQIRDNGGEIEYFCEKGPAYNNMYNFSLRENVSFMLGRYNRCDHEMARKINDIVKRIDYTESDRWYLPLSQEIPESINNYYFVKLGCEPVSMSSELFENTPIEEYLLVDSTVYKPSEGTNFVIDPKTKIIYD